MKMEDESTKDTKGEANGLPAGWVWTTIGQATQQIEKVNPADRPDQQFTYLDISSIDNTLSRIVEPKTYIGADAPSRARQQVRANDVLFSTVRTYLKNVAAVPEIYEGQIASTGFSVLRATDGIEPRYLYYYVLTKQFLTPLNELQRGTSYPAVRDRDVREQPFPVAPRSEQQRIVAKIEELLTRLDAGVAGLKRVQAALKRYRAAVLKSACEGRLVPQDPNDEPAAKLLERIQEQPKQQHRIKRKRKEIVLVEIDPLHLPAGWAWVTLADLDLDISDGNYAELYPRASEFVDNGVPFIRATNIRDFGIVFNDVRFISEEKHKILTRGHLLLNDVLIVTRGSIGQVALVTEQFVGCNINAQLVRIHAGTYFAATYLLYCLASDICQRQFANLKSGSALPQLPIGQLRQLRVPLPPLAEQYRIGLEVERRLTIVDKVEKALNHDLIRAERLRQSVLRRAFEGKLVTQKPDEEPAGASQLMRISNPRLL